MAYMTYQELLEFLMTLPDEQLKENVMFAGYGFICEIEGPGYGRDPDISEYSQGLIAEDTLILKGPDINRFTLESDNTPDPDFLKDDEDTNIDDVVLPDEAGFEIEMIEEEESVSDGTMDS